MSDDLGLDELTDDQLIEFARAIAAEIGRRETAVYAAARSATQTARPAPSRARAGDDPLYDWSVARRAAMMIAETIGSDWTFAVWKSGKGERRVYLDAPKSKISAVRRAHRPETVFEGKITMYATGSTRYAPGQVVMDHMPAGIDHRRVHVILNFIEGAWEEWSGTKVSIALASTIPAAPVPQYY